MYPPRCMTRHGYQPYVYPVKIRISLRPKSEPQAWFTVHAVPFAEGWGKYQPRWGSSIHDFSFQPWEPPISFPFLSMHRNAQVRVSSLLGSIFLFPLQTAEDSNKKKPIGSQGCPQPYPRIRHTIRCLHVKGKFHPSTRDHRTQFFTIAYMDHWFRHG